MATEQRLCGIFTGRDAVRTLAEGKDAAVTTLAQAMTPDPITVHSRSQPRNRRAADDGQCTNCTHLTVVRIERIWGIVSRGDSWVLAGLVTLFSIATSLMHVGQPTVQAANSAPAHYASMGDLINLFAAL